MKHLPSVSPVPTLCCHGSRPPKHLHFCRSAIFIPLRDRNWKLLDFSAVWSCISHLLLRSVCLASPLLSRHPVRACLHRHEASLSASQEGMQAGLGRSQGGAPSAQPCSALLTLLWAHPSKSILTALRGLAQANLQRCHLSEGSKARFPREVQ